MLQRLRGTAAILRALPGQRRAAYVDPEQLAERRDRRLRATIALAAETPYYRALFRRERIDPRELRTADDLRAVPLLTRDLLNDDPDSFRPHVPDIGPVTDLWTSGRSGRRLGVVHDVSSLLAGIAYAERQRAVEAYFCGRRYRYTVLEIVSQASGIAHAQRVYGRTSFRPLRPRTYSVRVEEPVDRVLATTEAVRPHVLRTYGSYAEALFRTVDMDGLALTRPRVLLYGGDAISAEGRALVERRFGVPVISVYGAVETPRIGFTCEAGSAFHLNEDLVHLRLLDDEGRDVASGAPGEVVVTNLVNRAMVLLNYRLADRARFVDGGCACGRTLRRLDGLEGRQAKVLRIDGELVHQYTLWYALAPLDGLVNFQLVQREPRRFELRIQAAAGAYERVAPKAAGVARRLLRGCEVTPVPVTMLDLERRTGKFSRVVSLEDLHATDDERA